MLHYICLWGNMLHYICLWGHMLHYIFILKKHAEIAIPLHWLEIAFLINFSYYQYTVTEHYI